MHMADFGPNNHCPIDKHEDFHLYLYTEIKRVNFSLTSVGGA